jgi:hypothetical protein
LGRPSATHGYVGNLAGIGLHGDVLDGPEQIAHVAVEVGPAGLPVGAAVVDSEFERGCCCAIKAAVSDWTVPANTRCVCIGSALSREVVNTPSPAEGVDYREIRVYAVNCSST